MFRFVKKIKALEEQASKQGKGIELLKLALKEKEMKTISQRTTEEEPVPFAVIMDEWLNGGKEEDNGN